MFLTVLLHISAANLTGQTGLPILKNQHFFRIMCTSYLIFLQKKYSIATVPEVFYVKEKTNEQITFFFLTLFKTQFHLLHPSVLNKSHFTYE